MKDILENRKKLTLLIVSFCIVLILIIFGIFMIDKNIGAKKKDKPKNEYDTKLEEMGISEKEYKNMTDKEKNKKIQDEYADRTSPDYIYKKGNKEFSDYDTAMKIVTEYLGSYDFDKVESYLAPLISKYNFTTTKNRELVEIYNDSKTLTTIRPTAVGYKNALNNLQHPLSTMSIYFSAPASVVKYVTIDQQAKYPMYKGIITLKEEEISLNKIKEDTRLGDDVSVDEGHTYTKVTVFGKTVADTDIQVECYVNKNKTDIDIAPEIIGCYEKDGEDKALFVSELVEE